MREEGEQGGTRESQQPADDRRTAEEYKLQKKRSGRGRTQKQAKWNGKKEQLITERETKPKGKEKSKRKGG